MRVGWPGGVTSPCSPLQVQVRTRCGNADHPRMTWFRIWRLAPATTIMRPRSPSLRVVHRHFGELRKQMWKIVDPLPPFTHFDPLYLQLVEVSIKNRSSLLR